MNGSFVSRSSILISPSTLGFARGYAAFEFFRTYDLCPFYLEEHLSRLRKSAQILALSYPDNLTSIVLTLLEKNNLSNAYVRIYLSEEESGSPLILILIEPAKEIPLTRYQKGVAVLLKEHLRLFPQAKSTVYLGGMVFEKEAKEKGFDEILFTSPDGALLELTKANFFAVKENTLITPRDNVLYGITRSVVITLARSFNISVEERRIDIDEIETFDEAFLSNTTHEICSISKINETIIPMGPLTKTLQLAFRKHVDELPKSTIWN